MLNTNVVVLDLETTGLSPYHDRITEIAAININPKKNKQEIFHSLVNPEIRIPGFITRLTGIDNELVKDAPKIKEVLPNLKEFLGDKIMIAHNATFDYSFLKYNFKKHMDHDFNNERLCTAKLARRIHSELPSKRLDALAEYYELNQKIKHRALEDTQVTCHIYKKMLDILHKADFCEKEKVFLFESFPVRKAVTVLNKNV